MTVEQTDSSTEITRKIIDLLTETKEAIGLKAIYYGDQKLMPKYPAAVVESYPKSRDIVGTHKFEVTLRTAIAVYHGKVGSVSIGREECEQMAETIEAILHEDHKLGGLVLFGYVARIEPGFTKQGNDMIQATRITWEGISRITF